MTEKEARTKWCPFARAHWSGAAGQDVYQGNRFFAADGKTSDPSTACIASDCAMWRQSREAATEFASGRHVEAEGYCGLAH